MKHERKDSRKSAVKKGQSKSGPSSKRSNTQSLSRGKQIARIKKQSKAARIPEISFDTDARQEFLTGFHKRKVERRNKAIQKQEAEARQTMLEMRAELRAQRKKELAQRLEAARAEMGLSADEAETRPGTVPGATDDETEWAGFDDEQAESRKNASKRATGLLWQEAEYEDDDKLISVTITDDI
jgi:ribosomal RNA-processing protein 17